MPSEIENSVMGSCFQRVYPRFESSSRNSTDGLAISVKRAELVLRI
jgi:hypothetical protein